MRLGRPISGGSFEKSFRLVVFCNGVHFCCETRCFRLRILPPCGWTRWAGKRQSYGIAGRLLRSTNGRNQEWRAQELGAEPRSNPTLEYARCSNYRRRSTSLGQILFDVKAEGDDQGRRKRDSAQDRCHRMVLDACEQW